MKNVDIQSFSIGCAGQSWRRWSSGWSWSCGRSTRGAHISSQVQRLAGFPLRSFLIAFGLGVVLGDTLDVLAIPAILSGVVVHAWGCSTHVDRPSIEARASAGATFKALPTRWRAPTRGELLPAGGGPGAPHTWPTTSAGLASRCGAFQIAKRPDCRRRSSGTVDRGSTTMSAPASGEAGSATAAVRPAMVLRSSSAARRASEPRE